MDDLMEEISSLNHHKRDWWQQKRWHYNKGLVIAGVVAFILYAILGSILIAPYTEDFEITLFTILFQGFGYLIMMGIANVFYNLGYLFDEKFNINDSESYRFKLYRLGYWFSVSLPFLIPALIIIEYFLLYAGKQPIQHVATASFNPLPLPHAQIRN